ARVVSARSFARTGAAGRIAGPGVGAGAADAAGIRLGAPGADLTVRAVGHAAVGGVDLPAATAVGQAVALAGRARLLCIGGGSDPGLHRRGRYLSAGWAAVPRGGSESLPAPCADRPDHVGPAAALLLPAEPVATAGAGRVAGPHRVVAGTDSPAFPVQQPEQHRQSGSHRSTPGRAGGAGPFRSVSGQPGSSRRAGALVRGAGAGAALSVHRALPAR